ncbi:MAG: TerC/Alx family metal homeostasis membrane protein [Puniceicoccales bacterium]|jgi:tellurite resistance protein TerC|nr:TerC/Alx family metal homeostasis membrane protein [Puniceicoccales bacterium]
MWWLWTVFLAVVICGVAIDIRALGKEYSLPDYRRSVRVVAVWVSAAMLFGLLICGKLGRDPWMKFIGGYALELSLAVDNLFVFMAVFAYFKITGVAQRKALTYGIIGAILMRVFFIFAGVALLNKFKWLTYVFGALLIASAFGMFRVGSGAEQSRPLLVKLAKLLKIKRGRSELQFFVKHGGRWYATRLFACVVAVEMADIVFSADSVPAILAITREPLLVCSSNIFAIIGLRALYTLLTRLISRFHLLKYGVATVLMFIGLKMSFAEIYHISTGASIAVIGATLIGTIAASFFTGGRVNFTERS